MSQKENIRASLMTFLAADAALVAVLPRARWVVDGARDIETKDFANWARVRFLQNLGQASRASSESRALIQVDVFVRPASDIYRREEIADAFGEALAHKAINIGDHAGGEPGTVLGTLRTFDSDSVDLGKVNGLWTEALTIDGYYTPAA